MRMIEPADRSVERLEETKRISRVLRTVQLISLHPRAWTRERLAGEFEISERMIDKDLELIRHGLCYDLRRGRGGYYFAKGPVLKPINLTVPEALALALAAQLARDTGTAEPEVIGSVLGKLESGLPLGIVPYLRRAGKSVQVPFGPVRSRGTTLAMLERGMAEGRMVEIVYSTASRDGSRSRRAIAPYYLQPYERSWIAIAADSLRGDVRMFKVDRIEDCVLSNERYVVPADFDPTAYLGATWGVLRGESGPPEDVELCFTAEAGRWVCDERWHPTQTTETLANGDLVMRFHCGVTHELVRWVLSFGGSVRVERPARLRARVVTEARQVIANEA